MLAAFCDLYNCALEQRRDAYARCRKTISYVDQCNELIAVRDADARLAHFGFTAEQQILRRLDKTFKAFFRRVKAKQKPGYPRFRSKAYFDSAEFKVGDGLTLRKSRRIGIVGVPGEIKVRWHRPLPEGVKPRAAVISRSAGKWFVCFQIEVAAPEGAGRCAVYVGLDAGLASLVALSTGDIVPTPQWTALAAKGLRRRQRVVARRRRQSARQRKARQVAARHHQRIANRRRDFLHKLSRDLVSRYTHIAIEDLNTASLARSMLAKSVHNAAWSTLRAMITYKAAWAGGVVVAVKPHGTSQACSGCGGVVPKTLADRVHSCPDCGLVLDRDVNAARNILMRAFGPGAGLRTPTERVAA